MMLQEGDLVKVKRKGKRTFWKTAAQEIMRIGQEKRVAELKEENEQVVQQKKYEELAENTQKKATGKSSRKIENMSSMKGQGLEL